MCQKEKFPDYHMSEGKNQQRLTERQARQIRCRDAAEHSWKKKGFCLREPVFLGKIVGVCHILSHSIYSLRI